MRAKGRLLIVGVRTGTLALGLIGLASAEPSGGLPDLTVTRIQYITSGGRCETPTELEIKATITNQGTADAGSFVSGITLTGERVGKLSLDGLAVGASVKIRAIIRYEGEHITVNAIADTKHEVVESDESNNGASKPFTCRPH